MLLVVLGLGAWLLGPHAWAWHHSRAGLQRLEAYEPAAAQAHLEKALRVWPGSAETHRLAARAARQAGQLDDAHRHLRECQRLEPELSDATVLEWALFRASAGELEVVEPFLRGKLEGRPPESALIYEALIEGYLKVYRIFEALGGLKEWLGREPDHPVALSLRGRVWQRVQVYARADADFRRVVELDPGRDDDRYRLAECLLEESRADEAAEHLELLHRRRPDDTRVQIRLAFAWFQLSRASDSLRLLDALLEAEPDNAAALAAHAHIDWQSGRSAQAESYARRAVALNPFDRQAHFTLFQALTDQEGREAEARAQHARLKALEDRLTRVIDLCNRQMPQRPRDAALHHELGTHLHALGQAHHAANWFRSAIRLDPGHTASHAALADYYSAQGHAAQADQHRQRAAPDQGSGVRDQ